MTHFLGRTALVLLASTALTGCVSPYASSPMLVQLPPPAPAPQVATAPEPTAAPLSPVETARLAPLAPAQPAAVAEAERTQARAYEPPAVDAFARTRRAQGTPATYTVRRGDTLAVIAGRLGVDMGDLAKANDLRRPYRLQPGQVLKNPKAKASSAPRSSSGSSRSSDTSSETYTVRSGDTLFGIALRLGTTVDALKSANGMGRSSSIFRGQKLKVPGGAADDAPDAQEADDAPSPRASSSRRERERDRADEAAETPAGAGREVTGRVVTIDTPGRSYRVKRGDNLEEIAGRLDSTVSELAKLNKLKRPYRLQPGQTIRGPGGTAKAYVVGRGDTLSEIAQRFSTTVEKLRSANGLRRGASVAPGRKLRLPAGYRDRGPIASEAPAPRPAPPRPAYEPPERSEPAPPSYEAPPARPSPPPPEAQLPSSPQPYRPSTPPRSRPSTPQPYRPSGPPVGAPTASPPVSEAQISQMGRGLFQWPIRGDVISNFGDRGVGQRNDGVNIRARAGDPVRASASGDVVYAGDQVPGFGNLVLIKHADGWVTAYGHLSRVEVRMQQKVTQGQQIGQAGQTGGVSEPQLHFEVRYAPTPQERARPVDPSLVMPR